MSADLAGSQWRPSTIYSHDIPAGERAFVVFQDDGRVTGNGGCNRFFGGYTVEDGTIRIGPIAATKMGCPGKYELETSFLAALQAATAYELDGTKLVLFGARGEELARLVKTTRI